MKENTTAASTTGRNDEDAEALASVIEKITALPNVATVDNEADAMEALQELNVTARVAYPVANNQILTTLRKGEDASYLYVYNYKYTDNESYQGQISIEGTYAPYVLDTWTGDIFYAGGTNEDGRTILDITLEPGDVAVYLLNPNEEAAPCESPAEGTVVELNGWNLQIDSFVPGDKLTRTEENAETGVTTTEVTFDTAHVTLDAGTLDTLVPWKDIEAIGENVSGVGTYTTTFTLEDGFNEVLFHAGSFNYGTASMEVNGSPVPVNMDTTAADLTSYVQAGENTITVNVTSSLRNILLQMPYIFWFGITGTQPDTYGMTGETTLTIR